MGNGDIHERQGTCLVLRIVKVQGPRQSSRPRNLSSSSHICLSATMSAPLDYEVVHCAPETDHDLELMNLTFNAKYDLSKYYIDPDLTAEIEAEKAKCAQLRKEIHQWKTKDLSNPEVMRVVFVDYIYESLKQIAELAVEAHANHWSHQLVKELGGAQKLRENVEAAEETARQIRQLGGLDAVKARMESEAAEVTARKEQQRVLDTLE
ncbi:hypothetical protein M3J09_006272 [Ascochyta lentis]